MITQATVVITTKDRCDDLIVALESVYKQNENVEVIVIDDGSSDDTSKLIYREFPKVRLVSHKQSAGLIARRNELARLSTTPILISIDDDAAFPSPMTIQQTLQEFNHPRIGAVAIPFINVRQNQSVQQQAPDRTKIWLTDRFIGTAHAIQRDLFLSLGGYREHFVHQGEEGDLCLRMLARGYVVRLGSADPIHHFESPRRSFERMDFYGRRNDVLFSWHNVPFPDFLWHLPATTLNGLRTAFRARRFRNMLRGLLVGYLDALRAGAREPVSPSTYRTFRRLTKAGAIDFDEIKDCLPSSVSLVEKNPC